jgi:ribosomal protein S18 acetylase RimI-like enzyme
LITQDILLERMLPQHLDAAAVLSRLAGWPHRPEDWAFSLAISDGIVALDGDTVVGTVLATPFGEDGGAVNLVIVAAAMRGRGLGRRLMQQALDRLGGRCCYLTATEDGLPLYEKFGFVATGEIAQHQGLALPTEAPPEVSWAEPADLPACAALDRTAFGHDRAALMRRLEQEARFAVLKQAGAPRGFAAIRPFGRGVVIGPVVAPDDAAAKALIGFLLAEQAGRFVRVDTDVRTGLSAWLTERGLAPAGGGVTMQRGQSPRGGNTTPAPVKTYALASQALG